MTTRNEFETIARIADRALSTVPGVQKRLDLIMDIDYAHQDIPIKLDELLAADDGNFMHDVTGIVCNLNRRTLKLENCFVPRYAVHA